MNKKTKIFVPIILLLLILLVWQFSVFSQILQQLYKIDLSLVISSLAFALSSLLGYLQWINGRKSDHRAPLSLSWQIEGYREAKVSVSGLKNETKLPQLRVFVNSGSIQRDYMIIPYPYLDNVSYDNKKEYPYFETVEAIHIHLNNKINGLKPSRIQKKVIIVPNSLRANAPERDAAFVFILFLGVDGSYHLLMLIYKNLSKSKAILEILDGIDCLTYQEVDNGYYIEQYKKCRQYLKENDINIKH